MKKGSKRRPMVRGGSVDSVEEPPYVFEKTFPSWVAQKYAQYRLTPPEPIDRCVDAQSGKVKPRGPWDTDPDKFALHKAGGDKQNFERMKHQEFVRAFFADEDPSAPLRVRGLYLIHGLGSGKSCSAIAIAEALKQKRNVVVMTPASLRQNFLDELGKCGDETYRLENGRAPSKEDHERRMREIERRFSFLHYDSNAIVRDIQKIPQGFDNKLVIIDEAHNVINRMCSGSITGIGIYTALMEATNMRLLLLSGTPMINDPFELAIATNLLRGYMYKNMTPVLDPKRAKNRYSMFPNPKDFDANYLDSRDPENVRLKNKQALIARMAGVISFYSGVQPMDLLMPAMQEHVVNLKMSDHQARMHEAARVIERELERRSAREYRKRGAGNKRGFAAAGWGERSGAGKLVGTAPSVYRIYSRQMCNFALPSAVPRPLPRGTIDIRNGEKKKETSEKELSEIADNLQQDEDLFSNSPEDGGKMSSEYEKRLQTTLSKVEDQAERYLVEELGEYSPKFYQLIQLIEASPGPVYVYTQFREMEGVTLLAMTLRAHGYLPYGWNVPDAPVGLRMDPLPHTRDSRTGKRWKDCSPEEKRSFLPLCYLVWPRSSKAKERIWLQRAFNAHDNRDGSRIRVFLSTKAGAEGISLMNVRQVHILEPFWNDATIQQAIGRSRRLCSHAALPLTDRRVDVYRYVMEFQDGQGNPEDKDRITEKPLTSDEYVNQIAQLKRRLQKEMMEVLRNTAVDCSMHLAHNRMAEGGDQIRCLTYVNPSKEPAYRLELDSDSLTIAAQSEIVAQEEELQVVKLPSKKGPVEVRMRSSELALLTPGTSTDSRELDLFHLVDPRVIGRLHLREGVPTSVTWITPRPSTPKAPRSSKSPRTSAKRTSSVSKRRR